ncbi:MULTISPECIES: recombinase family protein [unclassified Leptolyngbya]|uniref:recombinase family protein n=1 Tax=unclassified Leptolyngbya TaxID=2650499 RepID=UPI0016848E20|nr:MULTISPECIES: recombinase family protein [unclassified Leptolyngbya]MBD1911140.1 recombinase family protein [Leptolyngbya sp. FACHB-8]MBD2154339.1 recombinase family protein [Leptolyngbya sp. FACHB-16]
MTPLVFPNQWILGGTRSGKTQRLVEQFGTLAQVLGDPQSELPPQPMLVFAATGDNRIHLAEQLANLLGEGRSDTPPFPYPFDSTTPLGFFQDEVILFYPLLVEQLGIPARFPLRLRPETEQELATRLWQPDLESGRLKMEGVSDYFVVRRSLDLFQLAAFGTIPLENIPGVLEDGFGSSPLWDVIGEVLQRWREWCLERGLLTYGLVTDLYWRYLLPHPGYQERLRQRYRAVLADDVDEYPAIALQLFNFFLDQDLPGVFTFNPNRAIRRGLGADPQALASLQERCQVLTLPSPSDSLGVAWAETLVGWVREPVLLPAMPETIRSIQTVSRAQLLRRTAEVVIEGIQSGQVESQEVAIIGPGLDAIARYTLREILSRQGVAVEALNEQEPLVGYPTVRVLLTIMAMVYPGLGGMLEMGAIAELLIILSQPALLDPQTSTLEQSHIDPVRAGLLVDHCFVPDLERPTLLPITAFPRWDRLGYRAADAYEQIRQWISDQQLQQQQRLIPSPVTLLDRAIQRFLLGGSHLAYDRLAALREFMETAQHYWEVDSRLFQVEASNPQGRRRDMSTSVGHFITLLRNGTLTADPYPARPITERKAVTLATIYQYRAARLFHRWQFWLDAGSPLWLTGNSDLFGAPLMLQEWSGRPWTTADVLEADQQRLERQVRDLLHRTGDRVYLCHSDLATTGQEQTGPLLTLVNAARPLEEYSHEVRG